MADLCSGSCISPAPPCRARKETGTGTEEGVKEAEEDEEDEEDEEEGVKEAEEDEEDEEDEVLTEIHMSWSLMTSCHASFHFGVNFLPCNVLEIQKSPASPNQPCETKQICLWWPTISFQGQVQLTLVTELELLLKGACKVPLQNSILFHEEKKQQFYALFFAISVSFAKRDKKKET